MRLITIFVSIFLFISCKEVLKEPNLTYYEKTDFLETPRYNETIDYCKHLASVSPFIHYTTFGLSPQGRKLPLLIVDKDKGFKPKNSSEKAVIMIIAAIHAGEPDGKDAGLLFIRDFITKPEIQSLLDNITLLFVPILNVDGHERFSAYNRINQNGPKEMGWRTTLHNLNLNRDFLKAEAPEMQAWLKLFNEWNPHFFIDCHTTNGADYQYPLTYSVEIHGNMDSALTNWQKNKYLPYVEDKMAKSGNPIFPYVMFRRWHDPRSGLNAYASSPMLSQGYSALHNCPGLLIETHMLKDYKTRVNATYEMIKHSIEFINNDYNNYTSIVKNAKSYSASEDFRKEPLILDFKNSGDSVMVDFLGVDYTIENSSVTGGLWFKYDTVKKTFNLPYFNKLIPNNTIMVPEAYIIPAEWKVLADKLLLHGVSLLQTNEDISILVNKYRFSDVVLSPTSFEGHQRVQSFNMDEFSELVEFPAGSYIVLTSQELSRLICHLIEPRASSSLLQFGFFNALFEQKEYGESYVIEVLAREMLENDENLKAEFEEKLKDVSFANNYYGIINWFYSKSMYWDKNLNVYPIGKINNIEVLSNIKTAKLNMYKN